MHELSIIQKIIDAADRAARENGISKVKTLRLRLGQMAAANPEQLKFGFATYAKGSALEKADLAIEEIAVVLKCQNCGRSFGDARFDDREFAHTIAHAPAAYFPPPCPACGGSDSAIISGREMELVEILGD